MERMIEADQTTLLLSLQREMAEMRRRAEEVAQKNEQELQVLRRENKEMKKKLGEGGPSVIPTNVVGKSYTSPPDPDIAEGTKGRPPPREIEIHPDDPDGRPEPPTPLYQHHHQSPTA